MIQREWTNEHRATAEEPQQSCAELGLEGLGAGVERLGRQREGWTSLGLESRVAALGDAVRSKTTCRLQGRLKRTSQKKFEARREFRRTLVGNGTRRTLASVTMMRNPYGETQLGQQQHMGVERGGAPSYDAPRYYDHNLFVSVEVRSGQD